jgi:hypothetical protein
MSATRTRRYQRQGIGRMLVLLNRRFLALTRADGAPSDLFELPIALMRLADEKCGWSQGCCFVARRPPKGWDGGNV